jgi:dolichyl-phosphate-mannose-protein mannosyltransferase
VAAAEGTADATAWNRSRAPWRWADTAALLAVTVAGGLLRLWQLTVPGRIVFDEAYYAHDACVFVRPAAACGGIAEAFTEEHPLLGKWLIAAGVRLFGNTPLGWRVMPALAGTIAIALTFVLAWRLLRSTAAASLAAGLLALDGLHFVLSRVAMLDILASTFSLATILFVTIDRDRRRTERERLRDRPWLMAAGFAAGAAVATKWSGIPFALAAVVLALVWDRREGGGRSTGTFVRRAIPVAIALVAVPLGVYLLSFAGRLDGRLLAMPWDQGSWGWAFLRRQVRMLTFHADLSGAYPYESPAWSWPLLKRPVVFAFESSGGRFREILALGNPVVWWLGIVATLACAVRWFRVRGGPEGVILVGVAAGYLWWLPVTSSRSFSFLFYFLPALPFVCLGIARVAQRSWDAAAGRALTVAVTVAAVAAFVFFLPILSFRELDADGWTSRLWFTSCRPESLVGDPPRPHPTTVTRPPDWWCWI